jgi:hypothetical protein
MWALRIKKGFHRVGVILAVLALLVGAAVLLFGAYQWAAPLIKPPTFQVSSPDGSKLVIRYGTEPKEIGAKVKLLYQIEADRLKAVELIDDAFGNIDSQRWDGALCMLGSLISLIVAAALYSTSRAIGWVLAGFVGD